MAINLDAIGQSQKESTVLDLDAIGQPQKESTVLDLDAIGQPTEGVAQEFFEGIGSGLIAIPQGILELGASAVDLVADTDYASSITEAANKLRDVAGIDPEGLIGKGSEAIVQFVIPGLGAAGAVSKLSKANRYKKLLKKNTGMTKAPPPRPGQIVPAANIPGPLSAGEKVALGAQQLAAAGLVDAAVATDGTTTIADFFEGGPTQTNQEIGLSGRQEALRRLTNKLAIGAETGALTLAVPAALSATAKGTSKVLTETPVVKDVVRGTAAGVKKAGEAVGQSMAKLEDSVIAGEAGPVGNTIANVAKVFRYRGFLPQEVAEARLLTAGTTDSVIKGAKSILAGLDKEVDKAINEASKVSSGASPLTEQSIFNNLEEFMVGTTQEIRDRAFAELPENVQREATKMRGLVKSLNNDILNSDYMKTLDEIKSLDGKSVGAELRTEIQSNINNYLRRRYRIYEDKKYEPTKETLSAAAAGFKADKPAILEELGKIAGDDVARATSLGIVRRTDNPDKFEFIGVGPVTDAQAEAATRNFLSRHRIKSAPAKRATQRIADVQINSNIFRKRANMPDYQRALLGEIKDTKENFLGTVSDLAQFVAADNYFSTIKRLADSDQGIGKLFKKTKNIEQADGSIKDLTDSELEILREQGYRILDENIGTDPEKLTKARFGSLQGYAVPEKVYNDLTRLVINDTNVIGNATRDAYSGFLRLKGATQYGKTVLSPITQIRNVTTASLFAAAQGNIGRGANLGESLRLVYDNLFTNVSDDVALKNFQDLQQLGVVGSQAELREIQTLLQKGLGYTDDSTVNGVPVGRKFGSKITDNRLGSMMGNLGKKAENLYQAGDDIWKIYNYNFELNKLKNAYRGVTGGPTEEVLKQEAARIVRNTVPNYNMAPEAIRTLRRAPVGNFIAFPYEILRTGVNTVARGIDELASDNAEIRKIGLRRLTGAATTFAIAPAALSHYAYINSGVSKEEMDAYQRSMAPEWEKNARLIPTGRDKDGLPTYINYSYSNPYDMLERIVNGAMNKAEEGKLKGYNGAQIAGQAANEALGEFFKPFTEEAIITAKLRDVLDPESELLGVRQAGQLTGGRGGQTISGARVYNPEDDAGTKIGKSILHILDAIIPSAFPTTVSGGTLEPSRFARGFVSGLGLEEATGISSKDRYDRERELSSELARAFTGITENPIDVPLGLRFKGYEISERNRNSSNIYTTVSNRANASPEQFVRAYRDANEAKFRVQRDLFRIVEDMRIMGLEDREIRKILKRANVGDLGRVMRGEFDPIDVSSTTVSKNLRENDLRSVFPRSELNDIRRELRGRSLKVEEPQEPEPRTTAPVSQAPTQAQPVAAVATPPATAQAGVTSAPSVTPAPNTQSTLALLSSGNPIDALKNLQIFQRQQQ
jgi:hypothetical protein